MNDNKLVNNALRQIYLQFKQTDYNDPDLLSKMHSFREQIREIEANYSLSPDQKKVLQMEMSYVDDHITLLSISQEIKESSSPSKKQILQLKYTIDDIDFCLQNLSALDI
jgi:hypothetical protein